MSKIKIYVEWQGEELFFSTLKKLKKIDKRIDITSVWTNSKIFTSTSDINEKQVSKRINLSSTKWYNEIWFIADLENMNKTILESNIHRFCSMSHPVKVKFFLEILQFESWLLADIVNIKNILWERKKISYKIVLKPTENITKPCTIIKKLYNQAWKDYKKNSDEDKIAQEFSFERWKDYSKSLNLFYENFKKQNLYLV